MNNVKNIKTVAIIGAGASGIMAAITIMDKATKPIKVVLIDRLDRIGKKILATGNGRCNFTNLNMNKKYYHDNDLAEKIINDFSPTDLKNWFYERGLISKADSEGRVYPYSENATSVLDLLRLQIKKENIEVHTNFDIKRISKKDNQFIIEGTNNHHLTSDYVVLSTGGQAQPILGSNGSGYKLLKPWKVNISNLYPGLVGIKTAINDIKGLSGVRTKVNVMVYDKKTQNMIYQEKGEIIFKDDGLSGIVMMNVTSYILHYQKLVNLFIDFVSELSNGELKEYLKQKQENYSNLEVTNLLVGLVNNSLCNKILLKANIDIKSQISDLSNKDLEKIVQMLKKYPLDYQAPYGFDRAQVTIGGVDLSEIDENTLSLKKEPNIFLCGEILDIDGDCGGYNLHFAFSSGYFVGKKIAEINEGCSDE